MSSTDMVFTDSHGHLSSVAEELGREALSALLRDYEEGGATAEREGRSRPIILDPGTEPGDLPSRLELLGGGGRLPSFLRLAAGVWPSAANLASPRESLAGLEAAMRDASRSGFRIAAVGECGLDYHYDEGTKEGQAALLEGQMAFASDLGLPLIIHSRDAATDTLSLIASRSASTPTILHCFGYGREEARAFLDLGCWISFAGNLTYKKSSGLREACALVPADRLLLETDAPYMNPMPRRGEPSSPADIGRTYAMAAELRGVGVEELAETVSRNAHSLFG
jgi:TatD DNase family protein